jgi:C4-dicarboxylate-specific signal transduction histidine kinase
MEEKCGKSCDHLEVTVQERTAELVETNVRLQREILERKKTEQGLKAAYSELKETYTQLIQAEKMQEVGRLASGVAHEVKNPLAIILQGVEYLKDKLKTEDENITLVLKYIGDAIIRADNVVVGLLDFASLSKFNMEPGDLNSSIDNSLSLLRNDLDRYHIQVARNFKENLPLVKIDNNRIEQVFVNIILNAIQAMPTGGLLSIKTDIEEQEENKKYVVVQIQDTGTGISKETLEKIFNPFFTTRRSAGGSGLGLAVSRHIIQMHGGKIDIENREDQFGVRVTLSFKA